MSWSPGDFASKTDANQKIIVRDLRRMGWQVFHTYRVGQDFPDLVASKRGFNILIEIKNEHRPPSKRKLSKGQQLFHRSYQGAICVLKSSEEAVTLNEMFDKFHAQIAGPLQEFVKDLFDPEYY